MDWTQTIPIMVLLSMVFVFIVLGFVLFNKPVPKDKPYISMDNGIAYVEEEIIEEELIEEEN